MVSQFLKAGLQYLKLKDITWEKYGINPVTNKTVADSTESPNELLAVQTYVPASSAFALSRINVAYHTKNKKTFLFSRFWTKMCKTFTNSNLYLLQPM